MDKTQFKTQFQDTMELCQRLAIMFKKIYQIL